MTPEQFQQRIKQHQAQLNDLCRRVMPVAAGNLAKRHIEEDFRKGGFTYNGFSRWPTTRRQQGTGTSAKYGPLLSDRNHLSTSIEYAPGVGSVNIYTRVPYAAIHNSGGVVNPTVTPKMRKFAWAMHYKESGGDKKADTMWKRMALTKKTKLRIKIPKRQFMGSTPGPELSKKITDNFERRITKILK